MFPLRGLENGEERSHSGFAQAPLGIKALVLFNTDIHPILPAEQFPAS